MTIEDKLIHYWSQQVTKKITDEIQLFLENQHDMTSGDASCLENNWEEYCLQVQYEESIAWDTYMDHIESLIKRFYEELPIGEQFTLWLETDDGQEWYRRDMDRENLMFSYDEAPFYFGDCVKLIMSALNAIAVNFESENITNYIEYDCNGIDIDDEIKDMVVINIGNQAGSWEDITADVHETADVLGLSIESVNTIIGSLPDVFDGYDGDSRVSFSPQGWEYYLELKEEYE